MIKVVNPFNCYSAAVPNNDIQTRSYSLFYLRSYLTHMIWVLVEAAGDEFLEGPGEIPLEYWGVVFRNQKERSHRV